MTKIYNRAFVLIVVCGSETCLKRTEEKHTKDSASTSITHRSYNPDSGQTGLPLIVGCKRVSWLKLLDNYFDLWFMKVAALRNQTFSWKFSGNLQ